MLTLGYLREIPGLFFGVPEAAIPLKSLDLNAELALPAWYSSLLLCVIGGLMLWAYAAERRLGIRTAIGWFCLGVGFVYLSLDEMITIHEKFSELPALLPNVLGLLTFRWVVVGVPAVLVAALVFAPFLFRLPKLTARRLVVAGIVYVGGAVGMEIIDGAIMTDVGSGPLYLWAMMLEETLEVVGAFLALRCLVLHLTEVIGSSTLRLTARPQSIDRASR